MAAPSLVQIPPSDPHWIALSESKGYTHIFHHPAWSELMADCYGYRPFVFALRGKEGTLMAGIPLMEVTSPITGKRWVSLPFSDFCYPLFNNETDLKMLTEGLLLHMRSNKIPNLELRWEYPTLADYRQFPKYVIHEIDLLPGEDEVWMRIHKMHQRNIKLAIESDVKIIKGETQDNLAEFYKLHLQTRHRLGVPIQPWRFFKDLKRLLIDQDRGFLLLAYRKNQCIAGAIFLYWKEILTYKFGASRDDSRKYRPNNLVMWTAIQQGCVNGFSRFDLGRTDLENTGLRMFKSRWGAREVPLIYTSIGEKTNHPKREGNNHFLEFIIKKSPEWVCRLTGELLYKHFG